MKQEITSDETAVRIEKYTHSAKYAGKMLTHLDEAGCFCPSVVLFGDGSGHFIIHKNNQTIADGVFKRYLGNVPYKSRIEGRIDKDLEYAIEFGTFDAYRDVCHSCNRPL